jgi:hypothetical protein
MDQNASTMKEHPFSGMGYSCCIDQDQLDECVNNNKLAGGKPLKIPGAPADGCNCREFAQTINASLLLAVLVPRLDPQSGFMHGPLRVTVTLQPGQSTRMPATGVSIRDPALLLDRVV